MFDEKTLKHIRYKFSHLGRIDFYDLPKEWAVEDLLREFKWKVDWDDLFRRGITLNENFIRELIKDGTLTEEVIKESLSCFHPLSERFMSEFADKLEWIYISSAQKMSEEFMNRWEYKLDFQFLPQYRPLSNEFIERYENRWNWLTIAEKQKNIAGYLIERHKDEMPGWAYDCAMRRCK